MDATILFAARAVGAPALKDPPAPPTTIEGEWVLESRLIGGQPDPQVRADSPSRFAITREKWAIIQPMAQPLEWVLELDSDARPPALTLYKADDKGRRGGPDMSGIYRVDRDTLTICYVFKGERPADFVSPAGTDVRLMTLRRVKDK